ncbi:MAG: response regulator [Gemmatimonadales bacterium]
MTELPRVAVVEDNPDNRLLLQALLAGRYAVDEYESGPAALTGITARAPHIVLLDISLPEMDGAEVLRRLRADDALRPIPVVALTAHAMSGDRERFLGMGFDGYVAKPIIDETLLYDAIERLLTRRTEST